jgi:hypothetical protein
MKKATYISYLIYEKLARAPSWGDTLEFLAHTPNKMEENINPKEKDTTKRNGT